ncbi:MULTISPECIES: hypothetical protein [unclassified Siphonobacter]|nr:MULTISPECIES: hypothetical protein [unclassified Siphonobacter]
MLLFIVILLVILVLFSLINTLRIIDQDVPRPSKKFKQPISSK